MNHKRIKGPGDFEHPDFTAGPDLPDHLADAVPCPCVPLAKYEGYCLRCDSGWVVPTDAEIAEQEAEAV